MPTLSPDIKFSADRSYIKVGMCIVFTWKVENSREVYFYTEEEPWQDKAVATTDSRQVCQKETTTYYLRVVKTDGAIEVRKIRIPVEPLPGL